MIALHTHLANHGIIAWPTGRTTKMRGPDSLAKVRACSNLPFRWRPTTSTPMSLEKPRGRPVKTLLQRASPSNKPLFLDSAHLRRTRFYRRRVPPDQQLSPLLVQPATLTRSSGACLLSDMHFSPAVRSRGMQVRAVAELWACCPALVIEQVYHTPSQAALPNQNFKVAVQFLVLVA